MQGVCSRDRRIALYKQSINPTRTVHGNHLESQVRKAVDTLYCVSCAYFIMYENLGANGNLTPFLFETGGKHTHYLHCVAKGFSQHKQALRTHIDTTRNHNCVNNTCNCYLHCSPHQKVTHRVLHALLHKNVIVPTKKHVFHSHTDTRALIHANACVPAARCVPERFLQPNQA